MSRPRAVTIGHFDGVHRGHAALIEAARRAVGPQGRVVVLAFHPHPLVVLRPSAAPPRLSTFPQRREWLLRCGADEVIVLEPTPELLGRTPAEFLQWLRTEHDPAVVVEGPDFRFGRERSGDIATLEAHGRSQGYRTIVIDRVTSVLADQEVVTVSSTLVRWLVARGRVRDARLLLGRSYELEGRVVPGDRRGGRQLGFPTANLDCGEQLLPADGIYLGTAVLPEGLEHAAAISVGTKPTFGPGGARVCEAHLPGCDAPQEHGWEVRLRFHDWLRDQITYPAVAPLIEQMRRDVASVRRWAAGPCTAR
jgi:riboflavin kinase/FMN adenylyltransferase